MEDSDDFNRAVRVVIKRQLKDLLQQLHERGDEIVVIAVNTGDGTCSNFGSNFGEGFVSEQMDLETNFLKYCRKLKTNMGEAVLRMKIPTTMATNVRDLPKFVGNLLSSQRRKRKADVSESTSTRKESAAETKTPPKRPCTSATRAENTPQEKTGPEPTPAKETPVVKPRRSGRKTTSKYTDSNVSLKKEPKKPQETKTDENIEGATVNAMKEKSGGDGDEPSTSGKKQCKVTAKTTEDEKQKADMFVLCYLQSNR